MGGKPYGLAEGRRRLRASDTAGSGVYRSRHPDRAVGNKSTPSGVNSSADLTGPERRHSEWTSTPHRHSMETALTDAAF